MATPNALSEVLDRFAEHLVDRQPRFERATSGLSSAEVWRIEGASSFCLRGWPLEHPSAERLTWMHWVLRRAAAEGLAFVPTPLPESGGRTFIQLHARRWELTSWMPGEADYLAKPSSQRLGNAVTALAKFHMATFEPTGRKELIPGLLDRKQRFTDLFSGTLGKLRSTIQSEPVSPRQALTRELLELSLPLIPAAERELGQYLNTSVVLQPCIRDVHAEHVLFTGDAVTGLIDYGAMRNDSVIGDLVRLLTSLCGNNEQEWEAGTSAYAEVRPLLPEERALIPAWRRVSLLLSAINWLEWLYVERRSFQDESAVDRRLDELHNLLATLR